MEVLFYECWDKSRRRTDSIYLQKYHNLFVPIERQEQFKALDKYQQKKIIDKVYKDEWNKRIK